MKQLVVVGMPVGHSLSPVMHNAALAAMKLGQLYQYKQLLILPEQLHGLIESVQNHTIEGANITIPYKSEIMSHLLWVKEESQFIGAVNTLYFEGNHVIGCNTDVYGFKKTLKEHNVKVEGLRASILGAGGAARAVAYALSEDGVDTLEIFCRSQPNGVRLASMIHERFGIRVLIRCGPISEHSPFETDLLVNCTPVGMFGHSIKETPLNASLLSEGLVVMDLVYNPLRTHLLDEARRAGCRAIDGVDMLVYQGAASLELWVKKKPPTDIMRKAVLDALGGWSDV
jgi:shikimate dehydrogenase